MNITLIETKVDTLSLRKTDFEEDTKEPTFSVGTAFSSDALNSFLIVFDLSIKADESHMLTVKYIAKFEAGSDILEDERESPFFSINAPAIAYPFLRAFVANFMLSSGFEPIMLPTINFVKLAKDNESH